MNGANIVMSYFINQSARELIKIESSHSQEASTVEYDRIQRAMEYITEGHMMISMLSDYKQFN